MLGGTEQPVVVDATDEEIEAIVSEFGGDYRQTIRALLHDLTQLALDSDAGALSAAALCRFE